MKNLGQYIFCGFCVGIFNFFWMMPIWKSILATEEGIGWMILGFAIFGIPVYGAPIWIPFFMLMFMGVTSKAEDIFENITK